LLDHPGVHRPDGLLQRHISSQDHPHGQDSPAAKKPLKLSVSPKSAKAGQSTCYAFKDTSKGHGVKKVTVKLAGHTAQNIWQR